MRVASIATGAVAVLVGCAGAVHPADPPTTPPGGDARARTARPRPGPPLVTPDTVCDRILELRDRRCPITAGYGLTRAECVDDIRRSLEERGDLARQATTGHANCLLANESCEAIGVCVAALNPYADEQDGTPTHLRTCIDDHDYAPVGVSPDEFAHRKGTGVARYREAESSREEPIEVCGIPAEAEWLLGVTCDDGSRPFRNQDHAHSWRSGTVGRGGRCNSFIDLYDVPCPEGTYQIFMDAYVCPLPPDP